MNHTELTLAESLSRVSYSPKPAAHRQNLKVPFSDKDQARALWAKWDKGRKTWYIEAGQDANKFKRWIQT